MTTIRAALFDFSGTLFRLEKEDTWIADLTDESGDPLDVEAQAELMRRMTAPSKQVVQLDEEFQHAWDNRDLDPGLHEKVYLEVLRKSGVSKAEQAKAMYDKMLDPAQWTPYPDAEPVLKQLSGQGVPIGVISNIAFDIRPAFAAHGMDAYVDQFVLSFEEGVIKPDPRIFRIALDRLGVRAEEALMVGDSDEADGGARQLGCAFELVEPIPTAQRPSALLEAVRAHGLG